MRTLYSIYCVILILTSCNFNGEVADKPVLAGKVERNLTITTGREYGTGFGENYGEGNGKIQKTNSYLKLSVSNFSSSIDTPRTMRTILDSFEGQLFQDTLTIGQTWEQRGYLGGTEQVTLEGYEDVKVSDKVFPKCLKHKTVIKDANWESRTELGNALINGTRYLWFYPGVGVVKLRYEHSNGIITEGELIDSKTPVKNDELFPIDVGRSWTYKWKNDFENLTLIEEIQLLTNNQSEKGLRFNTITTTENGKKMMDGNFYFYPDSHPLLKLAGSGYSHSGRETPQGPNSMFSDLVENYWPELFQYPLSVGKSWTEEGNWNSQVTSTIEENETIEITLGTFKDCLKLKTVLQGATAISNKTPDNLNRVALINGTRYLWFAKGVGLVKLLYEHSNGITTESELIEYDVSEESKDYFPLNVGATWTYKWQNEYQSTPMIEKVVLSATEDRPEMSLKDSKYTLTIEDADAPGEMHVNFTLRPEESYFEEMKLRLTGTSNYIPQHRKFVPQDDEYKSKNYPIMRGITVEPNSIGSPHFDEYPYPAWTIKFFKNARKGQITLDYEISKKYADYYRAFEAERYGHAINLRSQPYFREDCMVWLADALFIIGGKTENIEVAFNLPEGWSVLTPWKRIGDTGYRFSVANQEELTQNFLLFGEFDEVIAKSGNTEVAIGIGGNLKSSKDEIQQIIEKFLSEYSKVFKDGPQNRVAFVINPYESAGQTRREGHGRRHSVSILMDDIVHPDTKNEYGPFLGHEVFHIWNGLTALQRFSSKEKWFSEGVTNYYSDITSKQLGYLSETELLNKLENACESYLSVSHEFAIGDDFRDSRLAYHGGSLVAASLDIQIRHLTKNKKNFNQVLHDMYRKFPDTKIQYTQEDITRSVNKVSGKDFEPFFKQYVLGKERLPLKEYFGHAGLDFEITSYEKFPTYEYVVSVIKESLERENMVEISHVNELPVLSPHDLCKRASEWNTDDVLELTYREYGEGNEFRTEMVTLKGISDNPPTYQEVSVDIAKMDKTTRLQRSIFNNLFGNK